jgi:hypothetical protein
MRILYLSDFDPAGVMIAQRDALRIAKPDWEVRVALRKSYYHKSDPDTELHGKPNVIVLCPGIGSGSTSSIGNDEFTFHPEFSPWIGELRKQFKDSREVFYIHGSKQTQSFLTEYRLGLKGGIVAASTLDYAVDLDCHWLPPVVDSRGLGRAELHQAGKPLSIAHSPSDPTVCHTREFLYAAITQGVSVHYISGKPHHIAMSLKRNSPVGFDHLRGTFSVNTIEFAALGMVPLFGLSPDVADRMRLEGLTLPPIRLWYRDVDVSLEDNLQKQIRILRDTPNLVQAAQGEAFEWYQQNFAPDKVVPRIVNFFESVMDGAHD